MCVGRDARGVGHDGCKEEGGFRCLFFFFQAEDGIRDKLVTGVQTCALPISGRPEERMGRGPVHLLESGLAERLRENQHDVEVRAVRLPEAFYSEGQGLVALQNLAVPIVREGIAGERRVLILSGNCGPAALSAAGALNPRTTGVVWFDAHADFNTPDT